MTRKRALAAVALGLPLLHPGAKAAAEGAAGERLFGSQCTGCHALEPGRHRAGPSLHGLFGRMAGSLDGYDFSPAMVEAEIEWTPATLDEFLADPGGMVPGTRMVFWGLEPEARGQIIRYLQAAIGHAG